MNKSKLIKVKNVFYQEKEDRQFPSYQTGLVLELEDGRFLTHSQDGFVVPFSLPTEVREEDKR